MEVIQKHNLQIASDFFFKFARLEYALKAAGYHNERGDAKVDWEKVAKKLEDVFHDPAPSDFAEAVRYYINHPPKKQMIIDGRLSWQEVDPNTNLPSDKILLYVRRVRNNLFHGGKFRGQYFGDPERSEILIEYALKILDKCLLAMPDVKEAYES